MSTHDYIISDASGSAFLADVNLAVKALAENNSSTTEPAVMYAHMWWADTTADILKKRNAANTGWISYLTLSTGAPLVTTGTWAGNAATATSATNATNVTGTVASGATGTTQAASDNSTKMATTAFSVSRDNGHNAVGSLCFAQKQTAGEIAAGGTASGADLHPCGYNGTIITASIAALTGTWRCLGYSYGVSDITLWQRVS